MWQKGQGESMGRLRADREHPFAQGSSGLEALHRIP